MILNLEILNLLESRNGKQRICKLYINHGDGHGYKFSMAAILYLSGWTNIPLVLWFGSKQHPCNMAWDKGLVCCKTLARKHRSTSKWPAVRHVPRIWFSWMHGCKNLGNIPKHWMARWTILFIYFFTTELQWQLLQWCCSDVAAIMDGFQFFNQIPLFIKSKFFVLLARKVRQLGHVTVHAHP